MDSDKNKDMIRIRPRSGHKYWEDKTNNSNRLLNTNV